MMLFSAGSLMASLLQEKEGKTVLVALSYIICCNLWLESLDTQISQWLASCPNFKVVRTQYSRLQQFQFFSNTCSLINQE